MGESFFVPYLYVPSAEAAYVKLVTPWGNVQMNRGFLTQLAISVGVVVLTLLLWRCSARLNATLETKNAKKKATQGDVAEEEEEEEEEEETIPDETLITQGENSYYFAQDVKNKDGSFRKTTVSSYGWTDHKETVSIFLTDSVVMNMKKEQLVLKWTNTSLAMDLLKAPGGDQAKSLEISTLFHEITDVNWEASNGTLTITLKKAQILPWGSLNGASKKMEEHIEYDDSFYD